MRLAVALSCLALSCVVLEPIPAEAASAVGRAGPSFRPAEAPRAPSHGFRGGHHGRAGRGAGLGEPWAWPWYDLDAPTGGVTIVERQVEEPPPVDPDAFENLFPRTGIRPAPTPEPVIYRIEGSRERPRTRAIRIAERTAVHAETGAVSVKVPAR